MTIQALSFRELFDRFDLIPQAIIGRPVSYFAERMAFVEGQDDLDEFQGTAMLLNGDPVALMHYRGHPSDTVTVYLPMHVNDVATISRVIDSLLEELKLPRDALVWQRGDDPHCESAPERAERA